MMKRYFNSTIWIVTELFAPNESATAYIMTKIAKHLAMSKRVKVICADSNYERDSNRVDVLSETELFDIIRVPIADVDKNNLFKRIFRIFYTSHKLYKELRRQIKDGDIVLTVTNPALLLLYMAHLRKRLHFSYYLIVHDIFPENMIPARIIKDNFLYRKIKQVFDKSYSLADALIVLGEDMKDIVVNKVCNGDKVFIIENWGDLSIKPIYDNHDNIVVQYAGNIGRVQGIISLLELIKRSDNKQINYEFWGSGALVNHIKSYIEKENLCNVSLCGSFSRREQTSVLGRCDIAIVTLEKGMKGLGVPSKSYNILAAGKPILFIGDLDSEIAMMLKKYNIGWAFNPDDTDKILSFFNGLGSIITQSEIRRKGELARHICEDYYSETVIMGKYDSLFKC